jgi:prepilin-type N-terminal cleavage/methylation domain-containing protein
VIRHPRGEAWRSAAGFTAIELLVVLTILVTMSAIAVPISSQTLAYFRVSGDARGVSNATAVAKMRAAADFTKARVYIDLAAKSHHIETWQKTGAPGWVAEGGSKVISSSVSFGFSGVPAAPPNTQAVIAQPGPCLNNAGAAIANTACIIFNSRGVPVDTTGAPTNAYGAYITDGSAVYGVTISATGMMRTWRTPIGAANWTLQ